MCSDVALTPNSHPDLWKAGAAARSAEAAGLWQQIAGLPNLVRTWRERMYFRRELMRLLRDGPELIDDIGLTLRQVEAELVKPFWQA